MKWRILCRCVGAILVLVGLCVGYWWFYTLGPARHMLDYRWTGRHSMQECWAEVQAGIHRGVWMHDDAFDVGLFGDKAWAEWIMNHITPDTNMGCFGHLAHSDTSMQFITNQNEGQRDAKAWIAWWKKNKAKSQEQWIVDGFAACGLTIDIPPTPGQIPSLLTLLGKPGHEQSAPGLSPTQYNAFRCLRDSDFDAVAFVLAKRPIGTDVRQGLLAYSKWLTRWPEAAGVGILPFRVKQNESNVSVCLPAICTPRYKIAVYSCVFVSIVLGAALTLLPFRRKKPQTSAI
jgi:hypothetical protein